MEKGISAKPSSSADRPARVTTEQHIIQKIHLEADALFAEVDRQYEEARQTAEAFKPPAVASPAGRSVKEKATLALDASNFPTLSANSAGHEVRKLTPANIPRAVLRL